jgi:cytochrome c peroxidase
MRLKFTWLLLLLGITLMGCLRDVDNPTNHPALRPNPYYFPDSGYEVPLTTNRTELFDLGKSLFFDSILSLDSTISCASCHNPSLAFSDNIAFSTGVRGRTGSRNSPPIFNVKWHTSFMWDGGVNHIEVMPVAPITDSSEMALSMRTVNSRLNNSLVYVERFKSIFKTDSITDRQFLLALTGFMSALISDDSRYDRFIKGQHDALTSIEFEGMQLTEKFCGNCHRAPLFTDHSFRKNGSFLEGYDPGRFLITNNPADKGAFKVPSLRNVALTAPYMHDGRFNTLEEVLNHYRKGIQDVQDIDPVLSGRIHLSDEEAEAILAFLRSLTDETFASNLHFKG